MRQGIGYQPKKKDEVVGIREGEWPPEWPPRSTQGWYDSSNALVEFKLKEYLFKMVGSPPVVGGVTACVALVADMFVGKSYLPEFARNTLAVTMGLSVLLTAADILRPRRGR